MAKSEYDFFLWALDNKIALPKLKDSFHLTTFSNFLNLTHRDVEWLPQLIVRQFRSPTIHYCDDFETKPNKKRCDLGQTIFHQQNRQGFCNNFFLLTIHVTLVRMFHRNCTAIPCLWDHGSPNGDQQDLGG